MTRPAPTKSSREIESDLLVVRPYAIGVVTMGVAALVSIAVSILAVADGATLGVVITAISLFTTQVIGYLLILAKQVEAVHRINSRMDELLESSGRNEYEAGLKQGRSESR